MRSIKFFRRTPIHRALSTSCGLLLAGNLLSIPVLAQSENVVLEELIVTARRTEESIMKVPVAVTALDAGNLKDMSISNFEDLRYQVPSLGIGTIGGSNSTPLISLRGQRTSETLLTVDAAVPMYFADVLLNPTFGANLGMYDLANVQVLKGPQGTLFGRNSTGGAVLITPQRPSDSFGGYVQLEAGNYEKYGGEFGVDLPASENFMFRLAGRKVERDGYQDNVFTGEDGAFGTEDTEALRFSILMSNDSVENLLILDYSTSNGIPSVGNVDGYNPNIGAFGLMQASLAIQGINPADWMAAMDESINGDWQKVASDVTWAFEESENQIVSNTTLWEVNDSFNVKNIATYRKFDTSYIVDNDGTPFPVLGAITEGAVTGYVNGNTDYNQSSSAEQFTEELQFFGDAFDGDLDWLAAGYYYQQDGDQTGYNMFTILNAQNSPAGEVHNKAYAIYGESTYHFTDEFGLTIGLRRSVDKRQVVAKNENAPFIPPGNPANPTPATFFNITDFGCNVDDPNNPGTKLPNDFCERTEDKTFAKNTYRLIGTYEPSYDQMFYGSVSTGYRTGGFNLRSPNDFGLQPFAEETVLTYEIGHKANWDVGVLGALRSSVALYSQDYKDIQKTQQTATPTGGTATVIVNAAEATINGAEMELWYLPTNSLEFFLSASYLDTDYKEWDYIDGSDGTNPVDYSDAPFTWIPNTAVVFTGKYTLPLDPALGDISLFASYYWQSKMVNEIVHDDIPIFTTVVPATGENTVDAYNEARTQEEYGIVDVRLDWTAIMGSGFDAAVFVKNLEDKEYVTGGADIMATLGVSFHNRGNPRTFGATVRYNF